MTVPQPRPGPVFCLLVVGLPVLFVSRPAAGEPSGLAAGVAGLDRVRTARAQLAKVNTKALRRAIRDLTATFPETYRKGPHFLRRLDDFEKRLGRIFEAIARGDPAEVEPIEGLADLRREALLANPLVDFDRLLMIRRNARGPSLGLPANWQGNCALPRTGYDDAIVVLGPVRASGRLTTLFKPERPVFVGDVDLDFDGDKMLFSMLGTHDRWQIWEIGVAGTGLRQVTPGREKDVDNYDACYLPDGRIIFGSTAPMAGVPCVDGSSYVANLFRMNSDGTDIRQLCYDQDHDWSPAVLNDGRVLYTRWEYSDTPHSNTRLLFHMNPDGTGQMEYYGSNSYWPTSILYARAIVGHPTKVVGIVTGHHGVRRMGELVILDPARGRREADGAVQRIPGFGKEVPPLVRDNLVDESWPKFLHPYPLSEKYFLVSCRPAQNALWGIYLVDVFDNLLLIKELPGHALFEPIPLRRTQRPPVVRDKVDRRRNDAVVYLTDIYAGEGLEGIPRGTVKKLRVFTYTYGYRGMGGLLGVIGMDGPWDIKRVLGTVPVEGDGSAVFRVPANTPISIQPLDEEGKALQLMRSWFTAMPGEVLSCVGCHEPQNTTPAVKRTLAARRAPAPISPWRGPARGFSFDREVQPVLDRYCAACYNGEQRVDGKAIPDLRPGKRITDWKSGYPGNGSANGGKFSLAYAELHRYVRRPGIENDYHLLRPMEFHADSTELVQMLAKGHHNVTLDVEAWDRLVTWIDLNTPYHGTWTEIVGEKKVGPIARRRREMRKRYAGVDEDHEAIAQMPLRDIAPIVPPPLPAPAVDPPRCPGWPFDAREAGRRQAAAGEGQLTIDLGHGVKLELRLVPPGEFVMGDANGCPDAHPLARVRINKPFYMGRVEVSNDQFALFDRLHDSGVESMHAYQFGIRGYPVNEPRRPVVRVSWNRAVAFCAWLSEKTRRRFTLPTEAQWEYACRAGSSTPFFFGDLGTDFSRFANLGDARLRDFARNTYIKVQLLKNPNKYDDWIPKDDRFNDGGFLSVDAGSYQPNAWGLCDMHGNVAEWTRSVFRPYPYREDDGRNDLAAPGRRVVRGGSWYDRPQRARSAFRLAYPPYQPVFNVGFRVVCEGPQGGRASLRRFP